MYRHCLGREFYPADNSEPAVRSQRMIFGAMSADAAADSLCIPIDNLIEKAHAAVVRDVRLYPLAIQLHGSTWITVFDPSKYSRTTRPSVCIANCRNSGRQRAAGIEVRSVSRFES